MSPDIAASVNAETPLMRFWPITRTRGSAEGFLS